MKRQYFLYMIFAVISTLVNIGSQILIKLILNPVYFFSKVLLLNKGPIMISGFKINISQDITIVFIVQLITGILAGFITKFILDKFIVFKEKFQNAAHTFKQIFIYGLLAVLTTLIFLFFEISAKLLFKYSNSELIGGIIGLAAGYTIKFFLDKMFVFKNSV